jgi:hypothetical protein
MGEPKDLEDAFRKGLQRAVVHLGRAGRELVAGVGAFVDEVVRVKRDTPQADDEEPQPPSRIDVE